MDSGPLPGIITIDETILLTGTIIKPCTVPAK
jgi:hypothetical protein